MLGKVLRRIRDFLFPEKEEELVYTMGMYADDIYNKDKEHYKAYRVLENLGFVLIPRREGPWFIEIMIDYIYAGSDCKYYALWDTRRRKLFWADHYPDYVWECTASFEEVFENMTEEEKEYAIFHLDILTEGTLVHDIRVVVIPPRIRKNS